MLEFLQANWAGLVVALLAISEFLGTIPYFKSNSVFMAIVNVLKVFKPKGKTEKLIDQGQKNKAV